MIRDLEQALGRSLARDQAQVVPKLRLVVDNARRTADVNIRTPSVGAGGASLPDVTAGSSTDETRRRREIKRRRDARRPEARP